MANKRGTRLFQTTVEWVKKGPIRANRGIYEDHMEISGLCEVKNSSRVALNRQNKLASLGATLVRNSAHLITDSLTDRGKV